MECSKVHFFYVMIWERQVKLEFRSSVCFYVPIHAMGSPFTVSICSNRMSGARPKIRDAKNMMAVPVGRELSQNKLLKQTRHHDNGGPGRRSSSSRPVNVMTASRAVFVVLATSSLIVCSSAILLRWRARTLAKKVADKANRLAYSDGPMV